MKLMSNNVTNNGISGKFTHIPKHKDLAATLMDTSRYFNSVKLINPYYYSFPEFLPF